MFAVKKCYNGLFCKVCLQVLYLPEEDLSGLKHCKSVVKFCALEDC